MTQTEFTTKLKQSNLPVAYDHQKAGTKVPFINYTWNRNALSYADDHVYVKKVEITVELVCNSKGDLNTYSEVLEDILDEIGGWSAFEGYSDEEQEYIKTYQMEV